MRNTTIANIEIGERIRNARKQKRMSMKTLGEKVNLHESTISRYEKGEIQALDIEKIKEFANVLNVSASYILGWVDEENPKWRIEMIQKEIPNIDFDESEMKEIIAFAKYLISKRNNK